MTSETGVFWLSSDPDKTLPGHLTFSDTGTPILEVHGQLTPSMQVISHNEETGATMMGPADEPTDLLVHGLLESTPRRVTLIDCMTTGRNEVHFIGAPLDRHKLQARVMVRGAHLASGEETFNGVRVRAADIDAWASLPRVQRENPEEEGVAVRLARLNLPPVETSKGVKLSLKEQLGASWGSLVEGRITRSVWIQAENLGDLTLRRIDTSFASPIVTYLSFALGSSSPLTALEVQSGEDWLEVRHGGLRPDPGPRVQVGDVLLPLHEAGLEVLSGFLDTYEQVGPAAAVVAGLLPRGSNPNIETQVAELTTVAEGVHRTLFPEDVRMGEEDAERLHALVAAAIAQEDDRLQQIVNGSVSRLEEANYKQRLKRLVSETTEALPGVCGKDNRWVSSVYNARNSFAHRTQGFLEENLIDEFYAVSQSLRWVLMGLLLLRSGVSAETLAARAQQNQQYQLFQDHMRSSLPSVYRD
ncbi:HEPN domain-containing protein [Modestobacter sp. VKM Ac-2978]|uniref:ApeA N-terminal domain 1-containing protein n=1 Tax=Modestobacter sp. VKM Ac-2978 TaxID=3004132 RepID=UPI0022AAF8B7|nr:HEPN domain-containing protein [Modestobacter sp. VKM Ac-2978]MCZ2847459.1 hypothetical protein [Modestobacter sp. VKM Ac-2978]